MKKYIIPIILFFVWASRAYAALDITEIMYDPKGPNAGHQWVEVYNSSSETVSIDDTWRFNDGSSHYINNKKAFDVPSSSYFVLTGNKDTFLSDHPSYVGLVIDTSMSLDKDGDTLSLLQDGAVVAGVTYVSSAGGSEDDKSLQKVDGSWIGAKPTPGIKNTGVDTPPPASINPNPTQPLQQAENTPPPKPDPTPAPEQTTNQNISTTNPTPTPVQTTIVPTASQPASPTPVPIAQSTPIATSEVFSQSTPATVSVLEPDPPALKKSVSKKIKNRISSKHDTTSETPIDLSKMGANVSEAKAPIAVGSILVWIGLGMAAVIGLVGILFFRKKKIQDEVSID